MNAMLGLAEELFRMVDNNQENRQEQVTYQNDNTIKCQAHCRNTAQICTGADISKTNGRELVGR